MKQMNLKSLIKKHKFDYVNSNITEEHFPIQPEDGGKKEYKLFWFNRPISSESAIAEMDKEGYRPVALRELLGIMENQEEKNSRKNGK